MLNRHQFHQNALDIINRSPGMIQGEDARTIFRAANIRSWPLSDHFTDVREGWTEEEGVVRPSETLHTSQPHLHGPTLRRYMSGDVPEEDPEHGGKYLPEIMRTEKNTPWINEGHHRLVASRLNNFPYEEVYEGPLIKMW